MSKLTPEEIAKIAQAVAQSMSNNETRPQLDNTMKVIVSFISFAIIGLTTYVFSGIQTLKSNDITQDSKIEYIIKQIGKMEDFTAKPRYTLEDANARFGPLENRTTKVEQELQVRSGFMNRTESDLLTLKYDVARLKEQLNQRNKK